MKLAGLGHRASSSQQQHVVLAEVAGTSAVDVLASLGTSASGLSSAEAAGRLANYGPNRVDSHGRTALRIFSRQLANPLLGLLLAATAVSFSVGERTDAVIIAAIMTLSVGLGFFDEYRADRAAQLLEAR